MVEEIISKGTCPCCGSHNVEHMTRVTGFFSKIDGWNPGKQAELKDRRIAIARNKTVLEGDKVTL